LGFGTRLSNTVSGFGSQAPTRNRGGYRYGNGTVIIPYGVPYDVASREPQAQAPITIVTPPPQIIYVMPGDPGMAPEPRRDSVITYIVPPREQGPAVAPSAQRTFLIALKNQSIYTATDYWVEDGTLHYVSPLGAHNQASLDQIDLEFTERLNRERGLEFRLDR